MNGGAKCTNWGSLGQLGGNEVIRNVTIRQSAYDFLFDFLIETMRLSSTVFEIYIGLYIAGYLSKVADLPTPTAFGVPVGGDPGRISRRSLGSQKRESLSYRAVLFM